MPSERVAKALERIVLETVREALPGLEAVIDEELTAETPTS